MTSLILKIRASEGAAPFIGLIEPSSENQEFRIELPEALYDFESAYWEDLRWYIEEYTNDPFSTQRAQSTAFRLRSYGTSLAHAICKSRAFSADLVNCTLLIEISGREEFSRQLAVIHWEILEDPSLWDVDSRPVNISVIRTVYGPQYSSGMSLSQRPADSDISLTPQHVLASTARPSLELDIPHRTITRSICEAVEDSKNELAAFKIVRPGTFKALQEALSVVEPGHYGLVHLDLHGYLKNNKAFLRFVSPNEEASGADDVPVADIAKLLADCGVRIVVLNACESASEYGPGSSIARSIVKAGVPIAVGMRYQISESAAEIFTRAFYRALLVHRQSATEALHAARAAMRNCQRRRTRFNTEVDVMDAITPIFVSGLISERRKLSKINDMEPLFGRRSESSLYGRENDILSLETALLNSDVVLLKGAAGTGKTYLMQHLCPWWKRTGFVKDHFILDCTRLGTLNAFKLRLTITRAFSLTSRAEGVNVLSVLNQNRYLIVLDNLDATKIEEAKPKDPHGSLRQFLRKIKKTFVVLVSRYDEEWAKAAAKITYQLQNLDMKSSLQLATHMVSEKPYNAALGVPLESRFLEQCITLVDGNPLSIKLILRAYDPTRSSMQDFYRSLVNGEAFSKVEPGLPSVSGERGFVDAQALVRLHTWSHDPASFRITDFRLLSPFWRTVPLDLRPYQLLFLRCKERILSHNHGNPKEIRSPLKSLFSRRKEQAPDNGPDTVMAMSAELKSVTEYMDMDERQVLLRKGNFGESELASLSSMNEFFRVCEQRGFMTSVVIEEGEAHVRLHPLLALALKQQDSAPPGWLEYAIKISFHRFYSYRSRRWPSTGTLTNTWALPRAQLNFEFANFVTANHYSLNLTPTFNSVFLMKPAIQISQGVSGDSRRLSAIFDFLEMFVQTFGRPLAENRGSQYTAAWASGLEEYSHKRKAQDDSLTEGRGMLEMLCILAITFAANLANILGLQRDYSPVLESIANNFHPQSDFADVNLPLLKTARLTLSRFALGARTTHDAAMKNLSEVHKLRDRWEQQDPGLKPSRVTRKDMSKIYSRITYDTIKRIGAATTREEIQALENELLDQLEDLLDEEDGLQAKRAIYESLAVLAFNRQDYPTALHHMDMTIKLAQSLEHVPAEGLKKLADFRETIVEASREYKAGEGS